jgi:hypothetical protein
MGRLDQTGNVDTTGIGPGKSERIEGVAAYDVFSLPGQDREHVELIDETIEEEKEPRAELGDSTAPKDKNPGGFKLADTVPGQEQQTGSFDTTGIGTGYPGAEIAAAIEDIVENTEVNEPEVADLPPTQEEAAEEAAVVEEFHEENPDADELGEKTNAELRLIANDLGADPKASDTKAELIAKIEDASSEEEASEEDAAAEEGEEEGSDAEESEED